MLDMSQAAVKKMIATARTRGYITYDELNEVLPPDQVTSEQIEDVMAMLSEMGINLVDNDEAEDEDSREDAPPIAEDGGSRELAMTSVGGEALDRTDDPVRMYLREMGSVELLSREGEIAIAKRIEAGRNTMIAGLCESPLTFQAITVWRDELLDEAIMLRDVIDLETTFSGQMENDEVESVHLRPQGRGRRRGAGGRAPPEPKPAPKPEARTDARPTEPEPAPRAAASDVEDDEDEELPEEEEEEAPSRPDPDEEEDEDQGSLSLAAMEAALKPQVLETLERIATDYIRLAEMQDDRISATLNRNESFSSGQERDYQRLRGEIVELVNSMHLHNNRIEQLVDQLYGINRRIMTLDGVDGEARRPGPHQPPGVHRRVPRLRARARLARPRRRASGRAAGTSSPPASATRPRSCATRWPRSASTSASTSPSSAASSTRCRRARRKPARPRRRWSRPTSAS